jgi:hypothetical protein
VELARAAEELEDEMEVELDRAGDADATCLEIWRGTRKGMRRWRWSWTKSPRTRGRENGW